MPEQTFIVTDLEKALDLLEDYTIDTKMLRSQNYHTIQNVLNSGLSINVTLIERLLAVCVHDLKEDMKYAVNILNVISVLLKKIKAGEYSPSPHNLVPSALAVIDIMDKIATATKVETLQVLCFDTLLAYPDDALIEIASCHHASLFELFSVYSVQGIEIRLQPINIIFKLLKILPPDKKTVFVKEGLSVWFLKVIPAIVSTVVKFNMLTTKSLDVLDLLTDELVNIDYANHDHWQNILEYISNPKKYPTILNHLLEKGSDIWYRLWIVFIRLLKKQSTVSNKYGSPVNCLLPVIESAFKRDVANRCRSFKCWNALIDNLSADTNELDVNKKVKLLLVPLRTNNAKVEETALAKLETWWHLIRRFQFKMDKHADTILIPFILFCFGKHVKTDKQTFVPGLLSDNMKKQCAQAFVEIVGHVDCEGCVPKLKLKRKLISGTLLVDHWNDWMYWMSTTIKILVNDDNDSINQQIKCMWTSFLETIAELPENKIREDLFDDVLTLLTQFVKESQCQWKLADIVFNILIKSLLQQTKIKSLFKTKDKEKQNCPVHRIISMVLDPSLHKFYNSSDVEKSVKELKPLTHIIVDKSVNSPNDTIEWLLENLPISNNGLIIWTALAETLNETKCDECPHSMCSFLLWPLKSMDSFTNDHLSASVWYTLYKRFYPKIKNSVIDKEITKVLLVDNMFSPSTTFLKLYALLGILKHGFINRTSTGYEKEVELLQDITSNIDDYKSMENIFPILIDTLVLILNNVSNFINETLAKCTLKIVTNVLMIAAQIGELRSNTINQSLFFLENLLTPVAKILKIEAYSHLKNVVVKEVAQCSTSLRKQPILQNITILILKSLMSTNEENDISLNTEIKTTIEAIEKAKDIINDSIDKNLDMDGVKFTTPEPTSITKKTKKKGTAIVNTVVENGEEYVVVKSNWKFNPRKLTEKQREKFQKKKEDIPALYQDLSQSQDEFKMTSWKTDSQDTSTGSKSTSKSTNDDVSTILKNIPSSDVVPTIMENIFSETTKKDTEEITNEKVSNDISNTLQKSPATKDIKPTRLALKDRVFRNVRNLIEKSNTQKHRENVPENLNMTLSENVPKTPQNTIKTMTNLVNSAPPKIMSERPSRVKRKPKRLEDSEMFALKKRRYSQGDSQSESVVLEKPIQDTKTISDSNTLNENCVKNADFSVSINNNTQENIQTMSTEECVTDMVTSCKDITSDLNTINREMDKTVEIVPKIQQNLTNKDKPNDIETDVILGSDVITDKIDNNKSSLTEIQSKELEPNIGTKNMSEASTRKHYSKKGVSTEKSSAKKNSSRTTLASRIEKELAIDMVEGHPFLKTQLPKRVKRKCVTNSVDTPKRRSVIEKLNKSKTDLNTPSKTGNKSKNTKRSKQSSITVDESQERCLISEDIPSSEDIIESSQDSTITTISVKSTKKKMPLVIVENIQESLNVFKKVSEINMSEDIKGNNTVEVNHENKEDTILPQNKTMIEEIQSDLTEIMDTEPFVTEECEDICGEVIVINDDESEKVVRVEPDTQEVADADTQPLDPSIFTENDTPVVKHTEESYNVIVVTQEETVAKDSAETSPVIEMNTEDDITKTIDGSITENQDTNSVASPLKDEIQRKKDFLNDTLEISPIKTLSPLRENKSPSPETSNDYVVIKLTSPVQSNGEPFEKWESPEIFTEEKVSPNRRDQSPPRHEISTNNTSPASSAPPKKNMPQMRSGGRAAQMLDLCVPDRLQTTTHAEKTTELEEPKKTAPVNINARRNLRILYNSTGDNNENANSSEDFLKIKNLPLTASSPSSSILKRKLVDIVDEATFSPASKRKRVSFHDPPVSTTISVEKYIEPCGIRSPQSSKLKRQDSQMRLHVNMKSPKRLDSLFKLDTVLTKTIESFTDVDTTINSTDDTEMSSLDQTPAVEVVKTSELNNTDPICPELIDCNDPVDQIAAELSSPTMSSLLIKELEDKVKTIGDLAKMTELEINRLCIKAPKVKVAKKVLLDYAINMAIKTQNENKDAAIKVDKQIQSEIQNISVEVQTNDVTLNNMEVQTIAVPVSFGHTQTDVVPLSTTSVQTDESGNKSTSDVIKSCLTERPDFTELLSKQLGESSRQVIAESLSFDSLSDVLVGKLTPCNSEVILNKVLEQQKEFDSHGQNQNKELSFLQNYVFNRFDSKDLLSFCIQLLQKIHEKSA